MQNIKNYGASVVPFTTDFSLSQSSKKNKEKNWNLIAWEFFLKKKYIVKVSSNFNKVT